mgnify:CR=1 FL=1
MPLIYTYSSTPQVYTALYWPQQVHCHAFRVYCTKHNIKELALVRVQKF